MANEGQLGLGMARYVSRYVGVFVGKVVSAGAGIVGACEKRAKAAGDLFSRRAKISEEVAGEVPEPSFERVVPEPSEGAEAKVEVEETEAVVPEAKVETEEIEPVVPEAKVEVEETEPVVRGTKVKAKSKKTTKAGKKKPKKVTKAKKKKAKTKKPKATTKSSE